MSEAVLSTPRVSCMSCAGKIEDALEPLEGIQVVDVDIELKQVNVHFAADTIGLPRIVSVLQEAGYEASPVASDSQ